MLSVTKKLCHGIVQAECGDLWNPISVDAVMHVIESYHGSATGKDFTPHHGMEELRRDLLAASPELAELRQNIQDIFSTGCCGIFASGVGLSEFNPDRRFALLYALCFTLGYPTPTDIKHKRLLWDVKPRKLEKGHFATFSEHSDRADMHTDTQYFPMPERFFILYAIRAARYGGGKSIICDGRQLKARLFETAAGRQAYELLSKTPLPFRIPTSFTQDARIESLEVIEAPIFAEKPFLRFRLDTLMAGLRLKPWLDTPEVRVAIQTLLETLQEKVETSVYSIADDEMCIVDNHVALHGRTSFDDPERHFIRVRMSERSYDVDSHPGFDSSGI